MGLHDRLHRQNGSTNGHAPEAHDALSGQAPEPVERRADPYGDLKSKIHHACIAKLGPQLYAAGKSEEGTTDDLAEKVLRVVTEQLALDRTPLTREERRQITREITDDILGYGPLEPLLRDDSVTEVMVNRYDRVFVERAGRSSSPTRASSTTPTCFGSSTRSSRRSVDASMRRRRWWTRAFPTEAVSTPSSRRSRCAGRRSRSGSSRVTRTRSTT